MLAPGPSAVPLHNGDARLARVEDHRLLTGRGRYVHDVTLPGQLHAVFVRSPHAHASILRIDTEAAQAAADVVAVLHARHWPGRVMPAINPLVRDLAAPACPLLAEDHAESVGQPIAIVVARSRAAAEAAAALVEIDYEIRQALADHPAPAGSHPPPVLRIHHRSDAVPALAETTPAPADAAPARKDAAPAQSDTAPPRNTVTRHRVSVHHRQPRVLSMSLEPRAALAHWDAGEQRLNVWLPTQSPARARNDIAALLGLPHERVRVIAPDVGGAFGAKASVHPEDLLVCLAAHHLSAAVKWTASRSEEFVSGAHGRGAWLQGSLAVTDDGRLDHLEAELHFPLGAWLPFSAVVPARNAARILPGPYRVATIDVCATATMSNAAAMNIYRGAGRPEAALLMERLIDAAARRIGLDPVELRRRALIGATDMPFTTPSGECLDSGDYHAALERACERFGYAQERSRQAQRRAAGELVGIGVAMYLEPCGQGWESARVTLDADGGVRVASGSAAQGQGHETSFAAIAAEALGCDPACVRIEHGDTALCPDGIGALASRSIAIGGSAVAQAARQAAQRRAAGEPLPLSVESVYHAPGEAWSYGCVIACMAVDRDTGRPRIERIVWVDDAGRIISPQLAEGQLLGGLAQGLGQAMMERIVYDEHGQLLTGSLLDYAVPRAGDMPPVEIDSLCTPSTVNLLGAKGVGEAGCIGVPAALLNAAIDALQPFGVEQLDFPLSAERLWTAMNEISSGE